MVRNESKKSITIYIAKNQTEKGYKSFASHKDLEAINLTNKEFADDLIGWLNMLTDVVPPKSSLSEKADRIFRTMCKFNWSRLDHYNYKLRRITRVPPKS